MSYVGQTHTVAVRLPLAADGSGALTPRRHRRGVRGRVSRRLWPRAARRAGARAEPAHRGDRAAAEDRPAVAGARGRCIGGRGAARQRGACGSTAGARRRCSTGWRCRWARGRRAGGAGAAGHDDPDRARPRGTVDRFGNLIIRRPGDERLVAIARCCSATCRTTSSIRTAPMAAAGQGVPEIAAVPARVAPLVAAMRAARAAGSSRRISPWCRGAAASRSSRRI